MCFLNVVFYSVVSLLQALDTINEIGDRLRIKFSRMPVPDFSENDEDFHKRCFLKSSASVEVTWSQCMFLDALPRFSKSL